ncbi:hypothetical protein [Aurantimonas sp. VKM B-3413]|uniref:hypothetical protein n=1 Tax=Aurantimonas sp. VKM B-3413 TaxID=2779401 RepID=UPI001E51349B|nr:hypothetical protein [Aurantimonas sp. VKM B-3413]MCB8837398.1 hypothetical protein [Aurantimonas sp. VKM B-3413]
MRVEDEAELARLVSSIAANRDAARELSMPFAARILDMCLLEVAMVWEGRDHRADLADRSPLATLLEIKLKTALAENQAAELSVQGMNR